MGRHDDPDPIPFYTSLGSAILRGLLALFLAFGLYAVLASIRDGDEPSHPIVALEPNTATESTAPASPKIVASAAEQLPSRFSPSPAPKISLSPSPTPSSTPTDNATTEADQAAGTTVQVLDGGAGERRTKQAVAVLRELGYKVVAVNKAVRTYKVTTVFYSSGQGASARALRARDARFAEIGPNRDLKQGVDLHVVVGTDWG